MSIVRCGGRRYLFSRREFPGGDLWDSMVRVAAGECPFGPASVTLDHSLNMSHNTAFLCVRNRRCSRSEASCPTASRRALAAGNRAPLRASIALPLRWGPPALVASGLKRARAASMLGGPTAAIRRQGVRGAPQRQAGNLHSIQPLPEAGVGERVGGGARLRNREGGRADGERRRRPPRPGGPLVPTADGGWSEVVGGFHQLIIPGLRRRRETNIYFFSVVPVGRHALLSLFPAVIGGRGGVWCSTSTDALHWAKPLLLMPSETVTGVRSTRPPLEVRDAGPARSRSSTTSTSIWPSNGATAAPTSRGRTSVRTGSSRPCPSPAGVRRSEQR